MASFGEYASATRLRDIVSKITRSVIEEQRPRYRYGTVTSIDAANWKCNVQMNGDTTSVTVNMGQIQPVSPGQIVRVEGIGTDKFVTDVIGSAGRKPSAYSPAVLSGYYGTPGSYTWTKPDGLLAIEVELWGGGGAGGGRASTVAVSIGAGGGAGGYTKLTIAAADLPSTVAVTVGAGGVGAVGAGGGSGGATLFGAFASANGGSGGGAAGGANTTTHVPPGGAGGTSSGGMNIFGQSGQAGWYMPLTGVSGTPGLGFPGQGGNAFAGGAGGVVGGPNRTGILQAGSNFGGGGSGLMGFAQASAAGGNGGGGGVRIVSYRE